MRLLGLEGALVGASPVRPSTRALAATLAILSACGGNDRSGSGAPSSVPAGASAAATSATVETGGFLAIGTEPFWSLAIDRTGLRFTTPDDTMEIRFPPFAPTAMGDTLRWVGETGRAAIEARVWPSRCSDGMSDRVWTHTAVVRIDGTTYRGCADASPGTVSSPRPIGEWVVVDHRIPGISAMTEAEAARWHGRIVRLGATEAMSNGSPCRQPVYRYAMIPADSLLAEFRITTAALGLQDAAEPRLGLTEVLCGDTRWTAMGGILIWVGQSRPYAVWDGVFFELRRVVPAGPTKE